MGRRKYLPWLACGVVAAIAAPGFALGAASDPPTTAAVTVSDGGFAAPSVRIAAGGKVTWSYPAGNGRHNIVFEGAQPEACALYQGTNWGTSPPLPWYSQGAAWKGACTFDAVGTYPYHSGGDLSLKGAVTVVATPVPSDPPKTAGIDAHDDGTDNWFQDASQSDRADSDVTIALGGRVNFSFATGNGTGTHNVKFVGAQPATCTQLQGHVDDPPPPLPTNPTAAPWSGYCGFDTAGIYHFFDAAHPEMTGTIHVIDASVPTPTPTPPPATADILAKDNAGTTWFQDAASSDPADNTVTIATGGKVNFSYPSGSSTHNVNFKTAAKPASCTQTAGLVFGTPPPMPGAPLGPGWAGNCTFNTPGTYSFVCDAHPNMTGTVVVETPAQSTPTPTPTATPSPTPTSSATPSPTATATPAATAAAIQAHDTSATDTWFQDASSNSRDDHEVTVAAGQSVGFSFPVGAGTSSHNVNFKTADKPASCTQTKAAGVPIFPGPPMPIGPDRAGWEGYCTFNAAGTYTFVCDAHANMTGTVLVKDAAGEVPTPAPTATATPRATATARATAAPTPPPVVVRDSRPAATPRAWAALVSPLKRLSTVAAFRAGRLKLTADCASVSPGRLTVSVSRSLARRLHLKTTRLATASGRCDGNNRFSVTLKPSKTVRNALRHYRKAVTATVSLKFTGGKTLIVKRTLKLAGKGK